jgi:hypothetical protein
MELNEFVTKSNVIHNNYYDYSKVVWVDEKTKVCVMCPVHGEFWIRPADHLRGNGCTQCTELEPMFDKCERIAKMYTKKKLFKQDYPKIFRYAKNRGWIHQFDWLEKTLRVSSYTHERCYELSRLCKSRTEFARTYEEAWFVAKKNHWDDCFEGLRNIRIHEDDDVDVVYCYLFEEVKHVYVGRCLKRRVNERHREHQNSRVRDTVFRYCEETGFDLPEMTILINGCTLKEGVEKEGYYMNYYRDLGYTLINKQPAGAIGSLKSKWTHKKCLEAAKQCESPVEFKKKFIGAYNACKRHKWYDVLDEAFPNRRRKYTDEEIIEIMNQYNTKTPFSKEHPSLARRAIKNDLYKFSEWKDGRQIYFERRRHNKNKTKTEG